MGSTICYCYSALLLQHEAAVDSTGMWFADPSLSTGGRISRCFTRSPERRLSGHREKVKRTPRVAKGNHKPMPSRVKSPNADLGIRTGNSEIVLIKKKKKSSDQSDVFAHTETVPGGGETNRTLSKKKEKKNLIFIYCRQT